MDKIVEVAIITVKWFIDVFYRSLFQRWASTDFLSVRVQLQTFRVGVRVDPYQNLNTSF
jgi:hypothetical protein